MPNQYTGPRPPLERFKEKYRKNKTNGCWVWFGAKPSDGGYGRFGMGDGHTVDSHRAAWVLFVGQIPNGLLVLHKCDNTLCVNPDHLFLGTQCDNMGDAVRKGRVSRGVKRPDAKLTECDVRYIRAKHKHVSQRELAKKFSISRAAVQMVIKRDTWKHVV